MARKPEQRDQNPHALGATISVTNPVKRLRVVIVISEQDLRLARFHEDAIGRLAVASEALKTVGNHERSAEVARIRDEVVADYKTFLANTLTLTVAAGLSEASS